MTSFNKLTRFPLLLLIGTLLSLPVKAETYTVGVVPQFDIKTLYKIWSPIFNVLEEKTGHKFEFTGSKDIPSFEKDFSKGRFDFAYMNPFHYTSSKQYAPLVKDHGRKLFGILAVKKDSEITSPEQLDGTTLAFPAPNALGASMMIRAELAEKYGINITPKYVKTHSSVYLNVALGLMPAGGGVQKTFNRQSEELKSQLRILMKTDSVEPHPFTVKRSLDPAIASQIQKALLEMGQDEQHKALLAKVPFKEIGTATDKDYDAVRKLNLSRYYVAPE